MTNEYSIRQVRCVLDGFATDIDEYMDVMGALKKFPLDDQKFIQQHLYDRTAPANDLRRTSALARKIARILNDGSHSIDQ